MKVPARATRKMSRSKTGVRSQSVFIYRAHKEVHPLGMKSLDFLISQHRFPQQVVLRLVILEASRLSKSSRAKVITLVEISAAVALVKKKVQSRIGA